METRPTLPDNVIQEAQRDTMVGAILTWRRHDGWKMYTFHATAENAVHEALRRWPDDIAAVEIHGPSSWR